MTRLQRFFLCFACLGIFAVALAGCASSQKVEHNMKIECTGTPKYGINTLGWDSEGYLLEISKSVPPPPPNSRVRRTIREDEKYMPYHPVRETGNFIVGVGLVTTSPVWLPVTIIFPGPEEWPRWFRLGGVAIYDLDIFHSKPWSPISEWGETEEGVEKVRTLRTYTEDWHTVKDGAYYYMEDVRVEARIPAAGLSGTATTDKDGFVYLPFQSKDVLSKIQVPLGAKCWEVLMEITINDPGAAQPYTTTIKIWVYP